MLAVALGMGCVGCAVDNPLFGLSDGEDGGFGTDADDAANDDGLTDGVATEGDPDDGVLDGADGLTEGGILCDCCAANMCTTNQDQCCPTNVNCPAGTFLVTPSKQQHLGRCVGLALWCQHTRGKRQCNKLPWSS